MPWRSLVVTVLVVAGTLLLSLAALSASSGTPRPPHPERRHLALVGALALSAGAGVVALGSHRMSDRRKKRRARDRRMRRR